METSGKGLVSYISPCAILGNGRTCQGASAADDLMVYDSSNILTANGSIYLVSHFPNF